MPDVVVLAVDPDQTVLSFVRRRVTRSGLLFRGARRGEDALRKAREVTPDAVLLRVNLPDMSGTEFTSRLRGDIEAMGASPPPILLSAMRGQEEEVATALERGAVSVLFFPFDEAEFAARLDGLLRWAKRPAIEGVLNVGPVSVDLDSGRLLRPQAHALTGTELNILRWLLNPPGRAVTRRQIASGGERTVDVHMAALRAKLGGAAACIETLRGVGYRFRSAACL